MTDDYMVSDEDFKKGMDRLLTYDSEPTIIDATVREGIDDLGDSEWHIECRFSDGQKFAPIIVDGEFPELADRIRDFINNGVT